MLNASWKKWKSGVKLRHTLNINYAKLVSKLCSHSTVTHFLLVFCVLHEWPVSPIWRSPRSLAVSLTVTCVCHRHDKDMWSHFNRILRVTNVASERILWFQYFLLNPIYLVFKYELGLRLYARPNLCSTGSWQLT